MNPCLLCGDKGDPRIVATYRGQCGECGREGPTRKTFSDAVTAWNADNPAGESEFCETTERKMRALVAMAAGRAAAKKRKKKPVGACVVCKGKRAPKSKHCAECLAKKKTRTPGPTRKGFKPRPFTVAKPTPIEQHYNGREL